MSEKTNKGLQIRARKLKKKRDKRLSVRQDQVGICRFVKAEYPKFELHNGRRRYSHQEEIVGLQIENKIYYEQNGVTRYMYVNRSGCKIVRKYQGKPSWAGAGLAAIYDANKNK